MSEDGLDEELIALVGEGQSSPPASPGRAQRRSTLLGDSSDEEEEKGMSYPLEGIYKDEEDREELLAMNELEREEVLAQRRDEISRKKQHEQLAAMVRSQQAASGKSRKSKMTEAERAQRRKRSRDMARRELEDLDDPFAESEDEDVFAESDSDADAPARRPSTTKASKLSELRRKRQERQRGASRRVDESDDEPAPRRRRVREDSDSAYESESDYEERRPARRAPLESEVLIASEDEPPSLELLNAIRVGRDELERLVFLPAGAEAIRGCFIRCSWGMRDRPDGSKEHVYRVHQITSVTQRDGKYYDVSNDHSGRFLNTYISFYWNGKEHSVDLRPVSSQPISDSERQRWIAALKGNATKFPSAAAIQDKQRAVEEVLATPLTEEDVRKIVVRKRELRAAAEASGAGRSAPPSLPQASGVRYDEHAMAQINERNRRQDRERIQEAERRAARAKRLAAQAAAPAPTAAAAPVSQAAVSAALASAPSGTAVVPTIDIDLGDF